MYVNIRFMHTYMCAHMGSIYGDAYFLSGCAVNFNFFKKKRLIYKESVYKEFFPRRKLLLWCWEVGCNITSKGKKSESDKNLSKTMEPEDACTVSVVAQAFKSSHLCSLPK